MAYEVIITDRAKEQAEAFVQYLLFEKQSPQAASNLLDAIEETKESLSLIAGFLRYCEDPDLRAMNYKVIFFRRMRYLWFFQINDGRVEVKAMYHQLQDYENLFKSEAP